MPPHVTGFRSGSLLISTSATAKVLPGTGYRPATAQVLPQEVRGHVSSSRTIQIEGYSHEY